MLIHLALIYPAILLASETLEEIEVSHEKRVGGYYFGSTNTLKAHELQNRPLPLLAPALEQVSGIVMTQNGGPGGRISFFIRGTESRHVAFTLDGLKLNDPSNTDRQFDAAFFTLPSLWELNVHKGPQAVIFGSDATGGHVEMITRKGHLAPEGGLSFNAGSFGTLGSSVYQDWKSGDHQGTFSLLTMRTDGISRLNKKRFGATERDAASSSQLTSSSTHQWKSKMHTDLLLSYLQGKAELDGFNDDNSHDHSKSEQYLLQQKTSYSPIPGTALSLRNGLNRHQRFLNQLSSGQSSFSGDLIQNEALLRMEDSPYLNILAGVASEHEEAKFANTDRSFDLHSFFSQMRISILQLSLLGGFRVDEHTRYGSFSTWSGGIRRFVGIHEFAFQYAKGYKAPTLFQLHAPVFGNPDLTPEENHSYEVIWRTNSSFLDSSVTLFQNRLSDLISFVGSRYMNQASFRAQGVEGNLRYKENDYQIALSATHQVFRDHEQAVLRRPSNYAQVSLSWFAKEERELFTRVKWFDVRQDLDENGNLVRLNPYETMDLGIRETFSRHELAVELINIFNREYEDLYGFSVMPRSIYGSYSYKF